VALCGIRFGGEGSCSPLVSVSGKVSVRGCVREAMDGTSVVQSGARRHGNPGIDGNLGTVDSVSY